GANTNEDLMVMYQAGNQAAFNTLYKKHESKLMRYLVGILKDRSVAEEVFQDVWMTVINYSQKYEKEFRGYFTAWLFTIARTRCMDYFRKNNKTFMPLANEEGEEFYCAVNNDLEHNLIIKKAHERFEHCLKKLPIEQCEVFILRQESELTVPQIAEIVQTPLETVKTRLRYALQRLRDCIGDAY
ncbi:MAG: sigma-70 family RNA polymerase sigma factor, partial [Pseudomonadales bacterium]|nr:sigma-70 family RNA polymerase sigma factor [Pseudomonadales bacterium]